MPLIQCPDCSAQISRKAPACPNCGNPMSAENISTKSNLVTVQKTSKTLKIHSLLSGLCLLLGVVMTMVTLKSDSPSGLAPLLMFGGGIWFIVTRVRIWWHHK